MSDPRGVGDNLPPVALELMVRNDNINEDPHHDQPMTDPLSVPSIPEHAQLRRFPIKLISGLSLIPLLLGAPFLLHHLFVPANFLAHGPFVGLPAAIPASPPSHTYSLPNGVVLQSYDASYLGGGTRTPQDDAVVAARNPDGTVRWCIYASEQLFDDVDAVRFSRHESRTSGGYKVEGVVAWSHGVEWTGWYLSRRGNLEKYYYQW